MKRILIALLGLSLATAGGPAQAQTPTPGRAPTRPQIPAAGPGEVRGTVVNAENNAPLSAASVAVWSKADSSLVTGAVTRNDGSFRIEGLRPGSYYVRVSFLGYTPQTAEEITITPAAPRANLGSIRLKQDAIALEGVQVDVERSAVAMAPDRNVYRAREIAPAGGNASDVLQAVPAVHVDADGKVSLRGNENVVVQINGRPAPLRGAQLAGYLQQLPANMLERVEVIPNPSAKYDPDGMAGIINIVMKQDVDLGMSGGFTLAAATADRYNGSGNLGYQRGPLTVSTSYGYNWDERQVTGINDRTRLGALRTPLSYTEQSILGDMENGGHNFNNSIEYRLTKRDLLSSALTLNRRTSSDISLTAFRELTGERLLTDRYDRSRNTGSESWMLDHTLGFKRTFEPQKHELSTELRFNRTEDEDRTNIWRQPLGENGQSAGTPLEGEINATDALSYQLTAQGDYTRTLAPRTKLETGYKGNARWLDRDFSVLKDALGNGQWERSGLSNDFDFNEQVHAAYGVLSQGAGKFELQGGLRAEYASRDFSLTGAESFPFDYTSLFPSAVVAYKPNEGSQVRASYSRRIRRPGTQELNPFPVFFDVQTVFLGNPSLNPEYTDAYELSFQKNGKVGSVQVSPFYRHTTDIIRFVIDTDDVVDGRDVTSVSFKNLATGNSWGTDVNGSLRYGPFSGFTGFNVFKMVTEGGSATSAVSTDAVTWMGRVNGTFNFSPKTSLQAMYFYRAPMAIEGGRFSSFSMTNLSLRQKLNDKATVTLRVADPFNTMKFRVDAGDDNIKQITERSFDSRAVHLTFQYNFGQAPRMRQRRPEPQQEAQPGFPQ
ncbi:TonB-dependent receptor [soil metagenome]